MLRKATLLFILGGLSSLVLLLGACKRAATVEPPELIIIPREATQTETPIQVVGDVTETVSAPTSEVPYPYPAYTTPEIEVPYPLPSYETEIHPSATALPAGGTPTATLTQMATQSPEASQTLVSSSPTPTATNALPVFPGGTPSPTIDAGLAYPGPETPYFPPYPGPDITATYLAYPGPEYTATSPAYPGPMTSTAQITPSPKSSATATLTGSVSPTIVPTQGAGTPMMTPAESPPRPPLAPPPPGSSITIWHSWGSDESKALQGIIQSFQRMYPDVTFSLVYIPLDDLYQSFFEAAYQDQGPSLLLGPSKWGPGLFDEDLVTNLKPYVSASFLESISPVALASAKYKDELVSLPLSQSGLLLFRNSVLISTSPSSFDMLISLSHQATHGGVVGSYLERGSYFSSPAIISLGGRLLDDEGYPAFNDQHGLEWIELLEAYDEAGAVTFNTNWDLEKFKQSRVGMIIDGSWNISMLAQSIGTENLAIDPWPTYGTGSMSGWVETDGIFLNTNCVGNNRFAALAFIGYLLDPNVQMHLAEVGHIPSVITSQPRDVHIKQAMEAFLKGVPYPITQDDMILQVYRYELDKAIRDVFGRGVTPQQALQAAEKNIRKTIEELRANP
jgi:maltose-binding protein MalE